MHVGEQEEQVAGRSHVGMTAYALCPVLMYGPVCTELPLTTCHGLDWDLGFAIYQSAYVDSFQNRHGLDHFWAPGKGMFTGPPTLTS